jgi:hypothetical protein
MVDFCKGPYSMLMNDGEFEGLAESLYREARLETDVAVSPVRLVDRLMGERSLRVVPASAMADEAALVRVGVTWRIYVRADLSQADRRFAALHELAHWSIGLTASEADCNRLAGALLVPRRAFQLRLDLLGVRVARLADQFGTTEACAWLRLGEVTPDRAIALVSPASVRIRGRAFSWPAPGRLRELAAARRVPGLRKAVLRDAVPRVVLQAI